MGFDLFGIAPVAKDGEYFRNDVWWWRPLAEYVVAQCDIRDEGWHDNRGHEVPATRAQKIADTLERLIASGAVKNYEKDYAARLAALANEACDICAGSGVRTDEIMNGTCNACAGKGTVEAWARHYPFSEANVREFAIFCRESGGFHIC